MSNKVVQYFVAQAASTVGILQCALRSSFEHIRYSAWIPVALT